MIKIKKQFRDKNEDEIRQELIKQFNYNKSLEEYEDIVIPKIHKN